MTSGIVAPGAPRDRPAGHAFEGLVVEGQDEVIRPAPARLVEALVHAVGVHQFGDPARIPDHVSAVKFQPAAPERMASTAGIRGP
jgi:hypothetical protein